MPQARFHIIWLFIFNTSLIILTPLIRGPGNYLAFTLIFLCINLLTLSFVWQAIKNGAIEIVLPPLSVLSLLFLGVILSSFFFTINPPSTRYGFFTMASVIINSIFLSFILPKNKLWKGLTFVLAITVFILSVISLYQYLTGGGSFEGRGHATFVNPNSFAGYLLLTMPVLIGLYLLPSPLTTRVVGSQRGLKMNPTLTLILSLMERKSPSPSRGGQGRGWGIKHFLDKYIFFFLSLVSFAALLSTGTGGRWILLTAAVAVALILFWIFAPPGRAHRPRLKVLATGFIAVLFLFFLPALGGENSKNLFSPKPAELSGSTADRLNIWKSTWGVIKEHPLRGVGFWSFHTVYSKYKNRIYKNVEHYFSHNDYLQLWAELGLIGAGVFLLLILFYFREGLRCLKAVSLDVVGEGLVPSQRETTRISPTHHTMLLSTLIGSFLLLVHTIGDFDLYIPSILFLLWGYIAYTSSTARELGLCKTKVLDLNSLRIFTMLGKKKLCIITAGIFAFLCFWVSDPYLAGLYNERGKGYLAIGEYEKAVKFFSKAVELDSIDDSYHFNFGLALAKSSNDPLVLKRAEDEMKKAIAIAPYRSDIYFNLANFYREFYLKEKGDIAVALMKKARELDPLDATISHNFGVLYMQLGMYKDAIDEFKRYLEEEPNDVDAHVEISGAYRMNKEYDDAIKEIDWVIGKTLASFLSPSRETPIKGVSLPSIKGRESPSPLTGEGQGEGYVRNNSNNNYAHFLKANILADMERYDAAYAEYQLALREKGKESDVWYAIGGLFLKQNKLKEAEEAFKKAAEYKLLLDRR